MALREVCNAIRRYDGRRGLRRIVIGLLTGTSDYFKRPKLVYADGRAEYSYILPALEPLLRQHEELLQGEVVEVVMILLYHYFHYLPDSSFLLPGAPGKHPAEEFCASEENILALTRYAEALTQRHSDRTPQHAGHCFRIIVAKVLEDGLPNLQIQPKIKEDFISACRNIPSDVWSEPDATSPFYGSGVGDSFRGSLAG